MFLSLLFLGCGSSRKAAKEFEKLPEWIKFKPHDNTTYYGVGKTAKIGFPDNYIKEAENIALGDLAESISVTISTNSLLYQFDIDNKKSEFYMNKQKIQTSNYIEGYDVFKTYENEEYYWTLVKISKQKYNQIKQQRKIATLKKAHEFYATAIAKKSENDFYNAVSYFVKSLETLKPYWKENTVFTKNNGAQIDLAIENINELQKLFNGIEIEKIKNSIRVKRGDYLDANVSIAVLKHNNYGVMENFPYAVKSSLTYGDTAEKFSKKDGELTLPSIEINTIENALIFELIVDSKKLVKKFTTDLGLRDILSLSIPNKQVAKIKIEILQPHISISVSSKVIPIAKTKQETLTFFEKEGISKPAPNNSGYHKLSIVIDKKGADTYQVFVKLYNPQRKIVFQKTRSIKMDPFVYTTPEKIEQSILNSLKRKELKQVLETIE